MQNVVINTCEKFHCDRLRNDTALGNGKSDNNKNNKNNVRSHLGAVSGSKNMLHSMLVGCCQPSEGTQTATDNVVGGNLVQFCPARRTQRVGTPNPTWMKK